MKGEIYYLWYLIESDNIAGNRNCPEDYGFFGAVFFGIDNHLTPREIDFFDGELIKFLITTKG